MIKKNVFSSFVKNLFFSSITMLVMAALLVTPAQASNCTAQASAAWSATSTWSCGHVPTSGDDVIIANGITVTLDTNATVSSLTIGDGANATSLTIGGTNSLTVTNDVNVGAASANVTKSVDVGAGTLTIGGNLNLNEGTNTRVSQLTISTGTVNLAGNINYASNGTSTNAKVIFTSTGTLNTTGNFPSGMTLTTVAGSTVNFNGAAQTIPNYSYKGFLVLSGSGVKTLPSTFSTAPVNVTLSGTASTSITGNFSMTGNLVVGSGTSLTVGPNYTFAVSGTTSVSGTLNLGGTGTKTFSGDVTVNSGGIWNESGVAAINDAGSLTNNGTYLANSGTHTFSGTTKTITATNLITIPTLNLTGTTAITGGTVNITTGLTNSNTLTVTASGVVITPSLTSTSGVTNNGAIYTGTFSNSGTTALTNSGWFNATTGMTIGIASTNNAGGIITTPSLTLNANLSNNGTLNITSTTAGASTLTNGATGVVNYAGATFTPALTASAAGNVFNYNGGGAQTVKAAAYSNLILSGSGQKTLASGTSTGANLSIAPGISTATAYLTAAMTANNLSLGGAGQNFAATTFGGTGSGAAHINTTYFAPASNGNKLTQTVADTKTSPTISFTTTPTPTFLGTNFSLSGATTNSDTSALVYSVISGPCVQNGANSFVPTGAGTCVVQAYGPASTHFDAAYGSQPITVSPASQAALTISASALKVVQGNTATLSNSGGSGTGAVTYSVGSSTGCTLSGNVLTVTDANGTCSVTATKASDNQYAQSSVSNTLNFTLVPYQVDINKSFVALPITIPPSNSIAPGGTAVLSIILLNQNSFVLNNVSFADDLSSVQPGIYIANPASSNNGCGGSLTANPGGTLITFSGGSVPAKSGGTNGQCTVTVNVTSTVQGSLVNTIPAGAVTAVSALDGKAVTNNTLTSVSLVVGTVLSPTVDKNFNNSTIYAGGTSTLTININNQDNSTALTGVSLTDTLPTGVVIANPPSATVGGIATGCTATVGSNLTATAGASSLTFNGATIAAGVGNKCTIKVNVTSLNQGSYINTIPTGAVSTNQGVTNLYPAEATLNVQQMNIQKGFAPTTIAAGGTSVVTLTLSNPNSFAYTGMSLTDTLPTGLVVSSTPGAITTCNNSGTPTLTAVAGASSVSLSGGGLAAGTPTTPKTCTIVFNVTSPLSQVVSPVTNNIPAGSLTDDQGITNPALASAQLTVNPALSVTKTISPAGITLGSVSTATVTLTNASATALSNVSMTDVLQSNLLVSGTPAATQCGGGTVAYNSGTNTLTLTGGSIAASGSCTVTFLITSSVGSTNGTTYTNTIAQNNACFNNGAGLICNPSASNGATLKVYTGTLPITGSKNFATTSIAPGGTSVMTINVTAPSDTPLYFVSITDNLLPIGLKTTNTLTKNGNCSGGTLSTGTNLTLITYTGGQINAGATCTLTVTVTSSTPGTVVNTIGTTQVTGNDSPTGNGITRSLASPLTATLNVSNFTMTKAFYPATVAQYGLSVLTITLTNQNTSTLTNLSLTDPLPTNVVVAPTPNASTDCGGTLTAAPGATSIILNGTAEVPAKVGAVNGQCTINVTVKNNVATGTSTNTLPYTNVTAYLGTQLVEPLANAVATITTASMTISVNKDFDTLTVFGGSSSTMRITLTNPNNAPLTGIAFTDSMPSGMYLAFPANFNTGTCGGTLTGTSGSNTFTYSGGLLGAAPATCDLTMSVSMNSNGNLTNIIKAGTVTTTNNATNPQDADATLTNLGGVSIHKAFSPNTISLGSTSTMTLIIQNTGNFTLHSLAGTLGGNVIDTLPGGLTIASNTSVNNCGGSLTATQGTNTIALSGANSLAAFSSCTITVPITGSSTGTYTNTIPINAITNNEGQTNTEIGQDTLTILSLPSVSTTANPTSGTVGTRLQDSASLTGGNSPTGTVTFKLFSPADSTCANTPIFSETRGLSGSTAATSTGFASNLAGTWHWMATYNGDTNNSPVSGACSDEPVVIGKTSPSITTNAATTSGIVGVAIPSIGDSVTSLGSAFNPTGSISFTLYSDSSCNTAVSGMTGSGTLAGGLASWTGSWTPAVPGTYYWKATYAGDANNNSAVSSCGGTNEQVTIAKSVPTITTTASGPGSIGSGVNDVAHLAGGFGTLGGTVSFNIYDPSDASCATPISVGSPISVSGAGDYTSASFSTVALGDYHWRAFYSGDTKNSAVSTACNDANETSTVTQATPALSTSASGPVSVGTNITDRAHLTGVFGTLSGSIIFKVYAPGDTTCTSPTVVGSTVSVNGSGDYTSGGYTPLSAGDYRWRAFYSGDTYNNGISSPCNDTGEMSTVNSLASPTLTTNASGNVWVGSGISDLAHLTGGSGTLTGTLAFNVYAPGDDTCSTPIAVDTSISVNGTGDYASSTYTSIAAGTYRWRAFYSGDSNNNAVSTGCFDSGETSIVNPLIPTLTTTASGPVTVGANITDTALLGGGYGTPTGTISFFVYAPGDTSCSTPTSVTPPVTVNGTGNYTSANFATLTSGIYRWRAFYSGDANNAAVNTTCNDAGESSTANLATPTITTTASGPATIGSGITDTAHLSGGFGTPTGTLTFKVYAPGDNSCATPTTVGSDVTVNGTGNYSSSSFTSAAIGSYRWRAFYSGDSNNNAVSTACNDAGETSTITQSIPTLTTTASGPVTVGAGMTDTAHLSGGYGTLGGTISFKIFAPGDTTCATPTSVTGGSVTGAGNYTSSAFTSAAAGLYRWQAFYTGDTNNAAVNTACNDSGETTTANPSTPILTTTASGPVIVGSDITDTAHISGGFGTLSGSLTFDVYAPDDIYCFTPTSVSPSKTVSGAGDYTSGGFTTSDIGPYRWKAFYSGDANNNAVSTACNDAGETSTSLPVTPVLTTTATSSAMIGGSITDTAHLSGGFGTPGGSISFQVFAPGDTNCSSPTSVTPDSSVSGNGDYTSAGFTTLATGLYRWRAFYTGDTYNNAVSTACNDAGETTTSTQAIPVLTTSASGPVTVGSNITDTATLSGGYGTLTGTLTFNVYAPGDTSCATPTAVGTGVTVNGTGSYTSANFASLAAGSYRWRANYSGDTNNAAVSTACNDTGETSTVNRATPTLSTNASGPVLLGAGITDTAHLGGGFGTLGGTISFNVYAPGDSSCATPTAVNPARSVSGTGNYTSASFTSLATGIYRWRASYTGDSNNNSVSTACNDANESSTVNPVTDLSITKTDGQTRLLAGSSTTYSIVIRNNGPSAANGAVFTDPSVTNLTVTGITCVSASNGAVCPASGSVTISALQGAGITIATLPNGGSLNFNLTGQAAAATYGSIVNIASIATPASVADSNSANNSATDTDTLVYINAQNDDGAFINGSTGGIAYTSVLADNSHGTDTLNGSAATTSTVTISPVGSWPTGINLNTSTGAVTVDPGTDYGNYTNQYKICDKANPTFCSTATVNVQVDNVLAQDDSGDPVSGTTGGSSVYNVLSNDLLNGSFFQRSDVTLEAVAGTWSSGISLNTTTGEVSVAPHTAPGNYTGQYKICDALNTSICSTATVTIPVVTITAVDDTAPSTVNGHTGGTAIANVLVNDLSNGTQATTSNVTITALGTWPSGIVLNVSTGEVTVAPGTTAGNYTGQYEICDQTYPTFCSDAFIHVQVETMDAKDDTGTLVNGTTGGTSVYNVLTDHGNGPDLWNIDDAQSNDVVISQYGTWPNYITLNTTTGDVIVGAGTPPGNYSVQYKVCDLDDNWICDIATVTVPVEVITANNDTSGVVNGHDGGPAIANILTNDRLNGQAITTSDVTITKVGTWSSGLQLNTSTGTVSVAAGTDPGNYTAQYQICDNNNPTFCSLATVTIPVESIYAKDDQGRSVNGSTGGSSIQSVLLDNGSGVDLWNNAPATTTTVTISTVGTWPSGIHLNTSTGEVTVDAGTATGNYNLQYQICDKDDPFCDTATVTIPVVLVTARDDNGQIISSVSGGTSINNVLADNGNGTDLVNVSAATFSNVTISPVGTWPSGLHLNTSTGAVTVDAGTPVGTYTPQYQICEITNNTICDTATVNVPVGIAQVKAHTFYDLDGNSVQTSPEPNLTGWNVTLYSTSDCTGTALQGPAATDSSGNYLFQPLANTGVYSVQETVLSGWNSATATPACQPVTVSLGTDPTQVNFGNYEMEWSGLVSSYGNPRTVFYPINQSTGLPTTFNSKDAIWLGSTVAPRGSKIFTVPDPGADGATLVNSTKWVEAPGGGAIQIVFNSSASDHSGSGYLLVWFDWNNDGFFSSSEAAVNQNVSWTANTLTQTFTFNIPQTGHALDHNLNYRVRLFESQPAGPLSYAAFRKPSIKDAIKNRTAFQNVTLALPDFSNGLPTVGDYDGFDPATAFDGAYLNGEVEDYQAQSSSLPVTVAYFNSQTQGSNVLFNWSTETETGNAGFNLYYMDGDGNLVQVNKQLIQSQNIDSLNRLDYALTAKPKGSVFYIDDVSITGATERHGPYQLGQTYGSLMAALPVDNAAIQAEHAGKLAADQQALEQNMQVPGSALLPSTAATATRTPVPSKTPTPKASATPTRTPTRTPVPSKTPTPKPSATFTRTPVPSKTPAPKASATPTRTPSKSPTPQATLGATATATPVPTGTNTPQPTATATATSTATSTPEPTFTPVPTDQPTPTASNTPTATAVPSDTPTATPTDTATFTAVPTDTAVPSDTDTAVPSATFTPVPTDTVTDTPVPTDTDTAVPSATFTPVPTDTDTAVPSATATLTPTDTVTLTPTDTATSTATATNTASPTPTQVLPAKPVTASNLLLGTSLNLKVKTTGLYRVTYETLKANGLDLAGVPANTVTLTNGNQLVPVYVYAPDASGNFGSGDYLEFYGQGLDTLYTDTNIYTVQVSNAPVVPHIPTFHAAPGADTSATSYQYDLVTNRQRTYANSAPGNDPWYDTAMSVTTAPKSWSYTFTVTGLADNTVPTHMNLVVWGMSSASQNPDHHLRVILNGTSVADSQFDGLVEQTISINLPAGSLVNGTNTLTLTLPADTGAANDIIYLDKYTVTYPRTFQAASGALKFTSGSPLYTVAGLTTPNVEILRVAPDGGISRLDNFNVSALNAAFSATFAGENQNDTYLVSNVESLLSPTIAATRVVSTNLDTPAQYLIISAPDFISGLPTFVADKQAQGFSVNVVDVNDLYARYTYGVFDPQAIKQYIAYASSKLGTQYVLLVGGDTYDYRNFLGTNSISFIPSLFANTTVNSRYVPADPMFADTNNDGVPDVAIGRFPVRTSAELGYEITKTLRYETKPYSGSAFFAADSNDGTVNFKANSNGFISEMPASWSIASVNLDDTALATAKTQLISAMTGGTALITYTGHSGPASWASTNLFSAYDAAVLSKTQKPFVVVQWGCWNTYSIDPNNTFLGQVFMLWGPDRGAAAVLGASTLIDSTSEQQLGNIVTPMLVQPGETIGAAVRDAKLQLAQTHPELSDVILGWSLLGDPALVIQK